ncbi:DUF2909 family protein [Vibrio maerlii]|uniref:DUF2909 family protein n=1 Tax=Vibrio maerlii TaxID=2231648 RepID=UPI000E3BFD6C|nr:DUF2909 family protein [Vibrio maerlii]
MSFLFKTILVLLLLFIIFNLAKAMFEMVRTPTESSKPQKMSTYLGRRVALSAIVVIFIIIALQSGLIEPNARPY